MPIVNPTGAPMPRAMLGYDGTDFYVVRTDAAGNLQVDVLASALPAGAATSANQATMITALQLIDDLRNALDSVNVDELRVNVWNWGNLPLLGNRPAGWDQIQIYGYTGAAPVAVEADAGGRLSVRGEDQHFSMLGVLADTNTRAISGANGYTWSSAVPAGEYWHVTHVAAVDVTSATTEHRYNAVHDAVLYEFWRETAAFAANIPSFISCDVWLDPVDQMQVQYMGGLVADQCTIRLLGYRMSLEA